MTKVPLVDTGDIDKSVAWFERHGTKGVFFGRMLPFFRSFISVPAGIERMNVLVFAVLTLLGSLIWNSVFVYAGYTLGANWHLVAPYASTLQYFVLIAIAVFGGWFVVSRVRRTRVRAEQR